MLICYAPSNCLKMYSNSICQKPTMLKRIIMLPYQCPVHNRIASVAARSNQVCIAIQLTSTQQLQIPSTPPHQTPPSTCQKSPVSKSPKNKVRSPHRASSPNPSAKGAEQKTQTILLQTVTRSRALKCEETVSSKTTISSKMKRNPKTSNRLKNSKDETIANK